MPLEDFNVLAPNQMGDSLANSGMEGITANYGYGVAEVTKTNTQAEQDQESSANPSIDPLRRAKAREFGKTMGTVGF